MLVDPVRFPVFRDTTRDDGYHGAGIDDNYVQLCEQHHREAERHLRRAASFVATSGASEDALSAPLASVS
jgi:hypothetical protein